MNFINEIWTNLVPMINWVVFIIVIASGYFISEIKKALKRKKRKFKKIKRRNRGGNSNENRQ